MGPYLIHPDKLAAIHNVVLKQRARRAPKPAEPTPGVPAVNGNLVLKLMQREYQANQRITGRSY